jgi:septum formation protein
MQLILASNSPRRKELLEQGGYKFTVTCSDFDENSIEKDPEKLSVEYAVGKARAVYDKLNDNRDFVVLGADTVVCIDGEILGKPKNEQRAYLMLEKLSGKTHQVITGFCIICQDRIIIDKAVTNVTFNKLSKDVINKYILSGLYEGKAGAYGIQDGFGLVKNYQGSYSNVVGLPIEKVFQQLNEVLKQD